MAFLLIVLVDGEPENTAGMLFRDINRCNYFSDRIERGVFVHGQRFRNSQVNITAYCTPRMVPEGTKFWDYHLTSNLQNKKQKKPRRKKSRSQKYRLVVLLSMMGGTKSIYLILTKMRTLAGECRNITNK